MTRLSKFFIFLILVSFTITPVYSVLEGGIDNSYTIDYTKLNKSELENKANFVYESALASKTINDSMTQALNLYTILKNIDPKNMTYTLRLGLLYDTLGKDRLAKGNYYQAICTNPKKPEPYFYFGNYFYKREQYLKALRFYKKAHEHGYSSNYELLEKINGIYKKLGDTETSAIFKQKPIEDMFKELEMLQNKTLDGGLTPFSSSDDLNRELEEIEYSNMLIDIEQIHDTNLFDELPD